jgi:hypothetical protein
VSNCSARILITQQCTANISVWVDDKVGLTARLCMWVEDKVGGGFGEHILNEYGKTL